jgi:hypothetical protein
MISSDQRVGQADPLAVALGEVADDLFGNVLQAALGQDGVHPLAGTPPAEPLQPGAELEILPHPHLVVEGVVLRHVADAAAGFQRLGEDIVAGHPRSSRRGGHVT